MVLGKSYLENNCLGRLFRATTFAYFLQQPQGSNTTPIYRQKLKTLSAKQTRTKKSKRTVSMAQVVEHLPSKRTAPNSNSSTAKK
jgi:hypothetical protein